MDILVNPINDEPWIEPVVGAQGVLEENNYNYTYTADDVDGNTPYHITLVSATQPGVTIVDATATIQILITGANTIVPGTIVLDPDPFAMGDALPGTAEIQTLTLTNTGGATWNTTLLLNNPSGNFAIGANPGNIDGGNSATMTITFNAPAATHDVTYNATLEVGNNGASSSSLAISARVFGPPALTLSPPLLDFGTLNAGESTTGSAFLTNIGGVAVTTITVSLTGTQTGAYSILGGVPTDLAPFDQAELIVEFSPPDPGFTYSDAHIEASAANAATVTMDLLGDTPGGVETTPAAVKSNIWHLFR